MDGIMDEKSPIRGLYSEHNSISIMLEILHIVTKKLDSGYAVPITDLNHIIDFFSVFADKYHHGKEEGLLIPEMKKTSKHNIKFINEILGEHETGRDLIKGMRNALKNYPKNQHELYHFSTNADSYITLLTQHIRKENVIMFPQANFSLSQKQQMKLADKFNALGKLTAGRNKQETSLKRLKTLERKYL